MNTPQSQTEIDAANRYHSYRRGWQHGVVSKAQPHEFTSHEDAGIRDAYFLGYRDGEAALPTALKAAQQRYGHTPSSLRAET